MAILDFKMAKELSENIFMWTAVINCTSNLDFIHFTMLFIAFLSLQYQKGLKKAILHLFHGLQTPRHLTFRSIINADLP